MKHKKKSLTAKIAQNKKGLTSESGPFCETNHQCLRFEKRMVSVCSISSLNHIIFHVNNA
jgi:hypothetical protein